MTQTSKPNMNSNKPLELILADILEIATGQKHDINFGDFHDAASNLLSARSEEVDVNVEIDSRLSEPYYSEITLAFPELHFSATAYYSDAVLDCVECSFVFRGDAGWTQSIAIWEFSDDERLLEPVWFSENRSLVGVYYLVPRKLRIYFVRLLRYLALQNPALQPQYEEVARITGRCCV